MVIWRNPVNNNAFPSAYSDSVEKQVSREADRGQNVSPVADMLHTGKQETSQHHTPDRQVPTLAQVQRGNHRLPLLLFLDDLPLKILWHVTTGQNCEAYCVMQNWSPKWLHQLQWCQQSRERPPPCILLVGTAHLTNEVQFNPNLCTRGFCNLTS